jgi:hypothetical protein
MRKTKPNLGGLGYMGKGHRAGRGPAGGQNAQNEPNLGAGGPGLGIADCGLEEAAHRQLRKTNPIGSAAQRCQVPCGAGFTEHLTGDGTEKTNPICGSKRAKRTQFWARAEGVGRAWRGAALHAGATYEEPKRAKRTQFHPAGGG